MSGPKIPISNLNLQEMIHDQSGKAREKRDEAALYYDRHLTRSPAPDSSRDFDRDFHQAEFEKIQKQAETHELTAADFRKELFARTRPDTSPDIDPPERPQERSLQGDKNKISGDLPPPPPEQSKDAEPAREQTQARQAEPQQEMPVPHGLGRDSLQVRRENIKAMLAPPPPEANKVEPQRQLDKAPERKPAREARADRGPDEASRSKIEQMLAPPPPKENAQDLERQRERDRPRSR